MARIVFGLGTAFGGLGVALGAFAAHALRDVLSARQIAVFETGVRYQMYHALALMALAWAIDRWPHRKLHTSAVLLVVGTIVFSGSLQLLAVTDVRWLGMVTPFGGVTLILGWGLAAWRLLVPGRSSKDPHTA
jgi:uncharacterized membrane protein YgdD (TMEM256/DUF423 family)